MRNQKMGAMALGIDDWDGAGFAGAALQDYTTASFDSCKIYEVDRVVDSESSKNKAKKFEVFVYEWKPYGDKCVWAGRCRHAAMPP